MTSRSKRLFLCTFAVAAAVPVARLAVGSPILAYTPGEWDCACGDWYVYTTRWAIWNPLRDREPEGLAESFLAGLRDNSCEVSPPVCASALDHLRVSNWRLGFRKDCNNGANLYFKLTKYPGESAFELTGTGVVTVERRETGWEVVSYDAMF